MINWIASYPKSGNTWVRLFLTAYLHGEKFDINVKPQTFIQDNDRRFYAHLAPVDPHVLTDGERTLMRGTALLRMSRSAETMYVKTHCANRMIDWVPIIPPAVTKSAIYILRDPRDIAVSASDHFAWPIDQTIKAMRDTKFVIHPEKEPFLTQFMGSWSDHVQSWAGEKDFPVHLTRYEDLKANPQKEFEKIVKAVGFDLNHDKLTDAIRRTQFTKLREQEDKHGFRNRSPHQDHFFRKGEAGSWKDTLTEEQSAQIEKDHAEVMDLFGYEKTTTRH